MLGREIKRLRIEAGVTRHQLAKAIGVKFRDVEAWESGTRPVNRNIEKLERFFEFVPGHLRGLPTTPQTKFEIVTYHNGMPGDYFGTDELEEARTHFGKAFTTGDVAVRVWREGVRLTYGEAEDLLSNWGEECNLPILRKGAAPNEISSAHYKN